MTSVVVVTIVELSNLRLNNRVLIENMHVIVAYFIYAISFDIGYQL